MSERIRKGTETILLVDDGESFLEVIRFGLKFAGYHILVAGKGEEAIRTFEENQRRIDLVILDAILPDMSGEMVFKCLKKINPGVKVILSSGYTVKEVLSSATAREIAGFIQKPFGLFELTRKIREILGPVG
jgi:two-component system, cell cycle sensor histidine kinase and response regulator CckA